jgi:hypothetical protein
VNQAQWWVIVAAVVATLVWGRRRFEYMRLPTLKLYLQKHPHCRTEHGVRCTYCLSSSIKNYGYSSERDKNRVFVCNHCGSILYRH